MSDEDEKLTIEILCEELRQERLRVEYFILQTEKLLEFRPKDDNPFRGEYDPHQGAWSDMRSLVFSYGNNAKYKKFWRRDK